MPQKKTTIRYGKARTTPSDRNGEKAPRSFKMPMNKPKPQRAITSFVDEGRADGAASVDLIRQYQEAECSHAQRPVEIASGPTKKILECPDCGKLTTQEVRKNR